MSDQAVHTRIPRLTGPGGRRLRLLHLTTVDMSLALLLGTELRAEAEAGLDVWGASAPGPYVQRLNSWGIPHAPVDRFTRQWRPAADLAAFVELIRLFRRLRPDIVHTHTPKAGVLGRIAARLARVPVVVNTCHGLWLRDGDRGLAHGLVIATEAAAAWTSHAELYQNAADKARLERYLPRGRGEVVGNGVDLGRFRFDPAGRERVRSELGVAPDQVLVGTVGRRVPEKGTRELGRAARALADKAAFVWIGSRESAAPGMEADPDADLAGVTLVEQRDDMPAVYSAFDVFALPTYREGFSRAAMEAAAVGVPSVLTDIRGCREIGTHGEHLLLVPPGDAPALTAAVDTLVDDSALRARLGAAAHARAIAEFDQRRVAATSVRTYARVAGDRRLGWTEAGE